MRRLPPAKRNQLIIVVIATVALIGLVYFLLISPQNEENARIGTSISSQRAELIKMESIIKQRATTDAAQREIAERLARAEEDVATGDVYAWTYDTLRRFKSTVEIPSITQPILSEEELLPNFPYKQLKVTLVGTAFYHDLGKFISDFENNFPHMRLINLSVEPASSANGPTEKLNFRVDVAALVRPNN